MQFRRAPLLPQGNKRRNPAARLLRPRTIRGQLTRVLVVSIVLVLALLGVLITGEFRAYRSTGDTVRAVSLALSAQDLVHEVQRERGLTNGMLGGDAAMRQALDAQRPATDRALVALNRTLADNPPDADAIRTAVTQLASLNQTRAEVDADRIERSAVFGYYTSAIAALDDARPGLDHAQDDQVWRGLQALYALGDAKEFTGQERGFLTGVFAAGSFGGGEYVQFLDIRAAKQAALQAFPHNATARQRTELDDALRSPAATEADSMEAVAVASQHGPLAQPVSSENWWTAMTSVINAQRGVQKSIGAEIQHRAKDLQRQSALTLITYLVAALIALLALVALVVASVRAIVRPLAALASEADEVATQRLPALIAAWHSPDAAEPGPPTPVRTPDHASVEIESVAAAFDRMQTTAYELATEQSLLRRNTTESLANLGRRNQNLLRRQLALISDFEREELDPKALSNMFELDHLATRMRRNAESLLVLVGETSPRRWSEPIALTDMIRAALSEVEDYRRVLLRRIEDVPIVGAVVSELAHMLAELIENGLAFSPPDVEVEIYGRRLGSQYLLAVVDHGVGMSAEQLAAANARLRGAGDFLVAPTRFLGHYVVGRLGQRLGIEVELTTSPISGVAARMLLPMALLAEPFGAGALELEAAQSVWTLPAGDAQPVLEPGVEAPAELPAADTTAVLRVSDANSAVPAGSNAMDAYIANSPLPWELSRNGGPGNNGTPVDNGPDTGRHFAPDAAPADRPTPTHPATPRINGRPRHSTAVRPDPFPTLPAGPMKDSLSGAAIQRDQAARQRDRPEPPPAAEPPAPAAAAKSAETIPAPHTPPANEIHYTDAAPEPEVQRTRNGLVKRVKKTDGKTAASVTVQPNRSTPPAVERSPEQVRGMLSSFRASYQRGELDEPARISASTAQEDAR
ncbi:sensor histidine kinase [Nocardia alni]|uniref:sensor histidine kinase n=1 Tax=Nocardia alni TaxID=2815723 RepID=UPI0027DF6A2B|nr:nitrate- and nitrite sensing domain-containing protein [Nocardia alni]